MQPLRSCSLVVGLMVVAAAVVVTASPAAAEPPGPGSWLLPVDGPVTRLFVQPAGPYGAGHRGVDFAVPVGTVVRAAQGGSVTFAGTVAGTLHVVVGHEGGLRTSYSFLARADVAVGDRVSRGDPVGVTGGTGDGHGPDVFHFGLRVGERYVDPMQLFRPTDLAELVRLVPHDHAAADPWIDPPREARELARGGGGPLGLAGDAVGAVVGGVVGAGGAVVDAATGASDATFGAFRAGAEAAGRVGVEVLEGITQVAAQAASATVAGVVARDAMEIAERFLDWWGSRDDCMSDSAPADGTGGSGHMLLAVGGINSEGGPSDPTFSLDADALGYVDGEVSYYSYAPDGDRYGPEDTWGDLLAAGQRLGEQLKALHREHPGREIDLIAHSQGGVVVDVFLQHVYDPADPDYPPIGTVVTLSSPHEGAPLATLAGDVRRTDGGRTVLDLADAAPLPLPPSAGESTQQLAEDSELMRDLWRHRLPEHVDVTSVGASDDYVVPANRTEVPGEMNVTVDVAGPVDHGSIPTDPRALQVVRAALENRPLPCVDWLEGLRGAAEPVLITRLELAAGDAAKELLP